MIKYINKNKEVLKFYSNAARIIGWVLICGGIIWFLIYVFWILAVSNAAGELVWPYKFKNVIYSSSSFVFEFLFPGLIAIIVAQLIAYIIVDENKQPRLLRFSWLVLYAYSAFIIGRAVLQYYLWHGIVLEGQSGAGLLFIQPLIVPVAAKVLIIIALAQAMQRFLPVIEESKTLV